MLRLGPLILVGGGVTLFLRVFFQALTPEGSPNDIGTSCVVMSLEQQGITSPVSLGSDALNQGWANPGPWAICSPRGHQFGPKGVPVSIGHLAHWRPARALNGLTGLLFTAAAARERLALQSFPTLARVLQKPHPSNRRRPQLRPGVRWG